MTAPVPPADAWQPVEMRWRLIRTHDLVLDPQSRPWMVDNADRDPDGAVAVLLNRGGEDAFRARRDPDQTVRVLVPAVEAAGVVALREQLGPVRVLDRRVG